MSLRIEQETPILDPSMELHTIDASSCKTLKDFYDAMTTAIHSPEVIRNPGALTDILEDWEDFSKAPVVMMVLNAQHLLENEIYRYVMLNDIIKTFKHVSESWGSVNGSDGEPKEQHSFDVIFVIIKPTSLNARHFDLRLRQMIGNDYKDR